MPGGRWRARVVLQHGEEPRLIAPVLLNAAMVVQMLVSDIQKNGYIKGAVAQAIPAF